MADYDYDNQYHPTYYYDCQSDDIAGCNEIYRKITPLWTSILLSCWQVTLVVVGLLGNSVVIFASARYSAFNLDSVTVFFVQQLAICDLIYTTLLIIPCAATHIARGWVFGLIACRLTGYLVAFLSPVGFFLTMVISLHRILRCYYPMRMMNFHRHHAIITVIIIWVFSFACTFVFIGCYWSTPSIVPQFNPSYPLCYFNVGAEIYPLVLKIHLIVFMGIPFQVIVITNILLLRYSKQKTKDLRKAIKEKKGNSKTRGLNTIYLISALLLCSWTPLVIVEALRSFFTSVIQSHHYMRVAANTFILSSTGNPIIYCFANPKFKKFVGKLLHKLLRDAKASLWVSSDGNSIVPTTTRGGGNATARVSSTAAGIPCTVMEQLTSVPGGRSSSITSLTTSGPRAGRKVRAMPILEDERKRGGDQHEVPSTSDYVSLPAELAGSGHIEMDDDIVQEIRV